MRATSFSAPIGRDAHFTARTPARSVFYFRVGAPQLGSAISRKTPRSTIGELMDLAFRALFAARKYQRLLAAEYQRLAKTTLHRHQREPSR